MHRRMQMTFQLLDRGQPLGGRAQTQLGHGDLHPHGVLHPRVGFAFDPFLQQRQGLGVHFVQHLVDCRQPGSRVGMGQAQPGQGATDLGA